MLVEAIQQGFYGNARRRVGSRFEVPSGLKATWFVPVGEVKPPKPKPGDKTPSTLSEMGKQGAVGPTDLA